MSEIKSAQATMKNVMVRCLEYMAYIANRELSVLKRELYRQGIRIDASEAGRYRYRCRGIDGVIGIGQDELKTEIAAKLARYMEGISGRFRGLQRAES